MRELLGLASACEEVKAWRTCAGRGVQARPGIEPGPTWQGCGVSCCATQHNGLSHVACPQAAAKALLVAPLHATPVMSCAPCPARVACCSLRVATSHTPDSHGVCGHGWGRHHRGSGQALRAASRGEGPPTPGRLLRPASAASRLPARCSQTGPPLSQTAGSQQPQPTACTALRAVPQFWHTNPIPLYWRGCSSGARQ